MNYTQALAAYDAALAAWERSPTEERQAEHARALEVLRAAKRIMNLQASTNLAFARALLLGAILGGCATAQLPEGDLLDPTAAIDAWEAHGLPAGTCRSEHPYLLVLDTQAELQDWCGLDEPVYACTGGDTIAIVRGCTADPATVPILEHELRHWLARCSLGTLDGAHAIDAIWYPDEQGREVRTDADWGDECWRE